MPHPAARRGSRGFTLVEMIIVILILSIVYVMGMDTIATFEANQRADRAAREILAFFRFARQLAMTTGNNAKVQVNTAGNSFAVYLMSNGTTWDAAPYPQAMASGGTMKISLNTARELAGTTISVNPPATTAFIYQPLGTCTATGTVTFTYATKTKSITIPAVGDPQIN